MKKILLTTTLLLASLVPASATEYAFGNFDTSVDTSFHSPWIVPLQLELGKFAAGFTPTLANVDSWQVNFFSGPVGFYDPSGPEWGASLTLTNNTVFGVGSRLYAWAFNTQVGTSARQWALFTDPSWVVASNSLIDPSFYSFDFSVNTVAIVGALNVRTQTAATASIPPVPEPATWGLIGGFSTLVVALWRRRRSV